MTRDLTPAQLVWLRTHVRSFAPAERAVIARDESSSETYRIQGVYPKEVVGVYIETRPTVTAATCRLPLRQRLSAKTERREPGARA